MVNPRHYSCSKSHELIDSAIDWINNGHEVALLTLVFIEGSAPYPIGTQMLVRDDGKYKGQITGGCAEESLVQQALMVIRSGSNVVERYGVNSRFFDIKLPCGSGLDIEFNVRTSINDYLAIADKLKKRQPVAVSAIKTYLPTPRILLVGQGAIVDSLIDLAVCSGFDVVLFDYQQRIDIRPYCDNYSGLVSLFHEHELEIDILSMAVQQPLFYIGALGSRATHDARIKQLTAIGVKENLTDKIYGPIGLNIKSKTPAQIAVSILAQMIKAFNS